MKKNGIIKLFTTISLMLAIVMSPAWQLKAEAAEVIATVEGTVSSGTTSDLLKLSTKEGNMEIKIDSGTDASGCKLLLPERKVSVSVSYGSDGYLHAVKISGDTQITSVKLDASTSSVTGKISEKTKDDLLYFNTPQGEMQIKMDSSTNLSGCSFLVADKTYTIVCARGSDGYMHAVSITDGVTAAAAASSGLTPAPASYVTAATTAVSGTVGENTKENLLYLSTKDGEMQIVIDSNTDSRSGMVLTPGRKVTVYVYRGSDAYMHAANIEGSKDGSAPADVDTSSKAAVSGTVGSKSTENVLYLDTPQGQMELKLDTVRNVTNCKVLVSGKKLSVTCTRGSDAYMHVLDITGV